jgi:microcystin-dependent protein
MEGTIGEIRLFGGNFAPNHWAFCTGQIMSIAQNPALFSIVGTIYGGDGISTFALPNFAGRVAVGTGNLSGSYMELGEMGGSEKVTLTQPQMPAHTHIAMAAVKPLAMNGQGDETNPGGGFMASSTSGDIYSSSSNTVMGASPVNVTVNNSGSSHPHENMQPWLALNYIICLEGIFPSRG